MPSGTNEIYRIGFPNDEMEWSSCRGSRWIDPTRVKKPGNHRLTVRIHNRMIVSDPSGNNDHMPDAHAVSDALGSTWNGIAGKIEIRWTPKVWISDVES